MNRKKLNHLIEQRQKGAITEAAYEKEKYRIQTFGGLYKDSKFHLNISLYGLLINVSQFASYFLPVAGIVLPIILGMILKIKDEK